MSPVWATEETAAVMLLAIGQAPARRAWPALIGR